MYSTGIPVSLSHPCDVTDDTFILNDTSLSLGHTHSLFFLNYEICSTVIMWIPTHLYVLLLQEHPLLRESAGILQDAWWENRKGKQTSSSDNFISFFFFFFCFMGRGMTEWRIIPSLGPNLSKWGHNRWQNGDSKQQQSVSSSQRGYLGLCCWKHVALIAVKSLARKSSFSVAHTGKFM